MKKEIITISGLPGSGKSSTADKVAQELGYKRFSSGDFMRNIALDMGVSLNELSKLAETDQGKIDHKIDEEIRKTGRQEKIVIDSRLAFHWLPESFKVFLDLPLEVSKDRIWENLQNNPLRQESEQAKTPEEVLENIKERLASEKKRYMDLYKVDYQDHKNFDLVVDTAEHNLDQVVAIILKKYKNWLHSKK